LSLYTLSASVCLGLPLPRYELAKNPKYGELIRAETVREGILATKQGEDPHDEQVAKQRYVSEDCTRFLTGSYTHIPRRFAAPLGTPRCNE
jgi:hypothetical protein